MCTRTDRPILHTMVAALVLLCGGWGEGSAEEARNLLEDPVYIAGKAAGSWCQTTSTAALSACDVGGWCDNSLNRDQTNTTEEYIVRVVVHVVREDNGNFPIGSPYVSQADVNATIDQLNDDYLLAGTNISFRIEQTYFHNSTTHATLPTSPPGAFQTSLTALKQNFSTSSTTMLNIFVAYSPPAPNGSRIAGVGHFPWESDALQATGGLFLNTRDVGAFGKTATHEVGHTLGLWHTFHGVAELTPDWPVYSQRCGANCVEVTGNPSDTTGDLCSDTDPTPRSWTCAPPPDPSSEPPDTLDVCVGLPWSSSGVFTNYMGYGGDTCINHFTSQQVKRMRCWLNDRLSTWLVGFVPISGSVATQSGTGIPGVLLQGLPGDPTTSANGSYYVLVESGWTGSVSPTHQCYSFVPISRSYSIPVTTEQTFQNYTGTQRTYSVSGAVADSQGNAIPGVTLVGFPDPEPITDAMGNYTGQALCGVNLTITPTFSSYTFAPESRSTGPLLGPLSGQNFTGTLGQPFVDVTAGDAGDTGNARGVAWADYDNDGDPDILVSNYAIGTTRVLTNNSGATFSYAPLSLGEGFGVAWGDYDNDGDMDLYLSDEVTNRLYRNDNGTLVDVTNVSGTGLGNNGDGQTVSWVDYDNDGWLDLHLVNGSVFNNNYPDRLFRNYGNGTFSDITSMAGQIGTDRNGSGAAWSDYDNDGDMDLYVAHSFDDPSALFRNDNGNFIDVAGSSGAAGLTTTSGVGACWGDYDNDGDMDLYVTCTLQPNMLFRNTGGTFADVTSASGPPELAASVFGVDCSWADYDNDGWLDLYVVNHGTNNFLFRNNGNSTFTKLDGIVNDPGDGQSAAFADYDSDGDLDLYLGNGHSANLLFRNDLGSGRHWIHVDLDGVLSNRAGIGARVVVYAGALIQIREVGLGSGHLSQNSLFAEFGLGAVNAIDSLQVQWPNGLVTTIEAPAVDQRLVVTDCEATVISNMGGWAGSGPWPSQMTLFFGLEGTGKVLEFKVRYRKSNTQDPWEELHCASPGAECVFGPSDYLEAATTYYACEMIKFEWQVKVLTCEGWTNQWFPSTSVKFTAYCLEEF